ncbi:MAG: hypothetical protein A3B37_01785 [Candidatus Sungbacteria bacterium RIFCSPLOWO2_01_FULL_59_16]|uniref:DUF4956 domain-containing protein n=1 Tax=Candidatus Sungbacteria bacterium RIFCSPLOWO2_01_FULL_59_16 TaxID=1802280 RepID=A0A1G2LAI1_9BACT|nr:MAG: hypothetical protein A3B37_01785 [Candidatus Sungbacteria bacterium RIFCSPLOWO2_01_FULL_59_16]
MNIQQFLGPAVLDITPLTVAVNLVIGFGLALLIAWIYKRTHSGLSYSQSFVFTLIILTVLTTATMMIIGSNIVRAFTLLGAFTIIRFRTAIKDTRDIAFVFWALITGMAIGTQNYLVAGFLTVALIAIIAFLTRIKFGSFRGFDYILNFTVPSNPGEAEAGVKTAFGRYLKAATLLNVASRDDGRKLEYTYSVKFGNEKEIPEFMRNCGAVAGIERVSLITAKEDIEY